MKLRSAVFYVKDINTASEFYQKLGFKITASFDKNILLATKDPEVFLEIKQVENHKYIPGKQVCSFRTDNVKGMFEKFKLLGIPLHTDLVTTDIGRAFTISDRDGNKIEFIEELAE